MRMEWNEHLIASALATQTFNRKHLVVVPNCNWTGHECDLLVVTQDLRIIDVEIKISRSDLRADAKKEKWWHRKFLGYGDDIEVPRRFGNGTTLKRNPIYESTPRTHPPKVWKHYYAMPAEIWDDSLFDDLPSTSSGVVLLEQSERLGGAYLASVRRPPKPSRDAQIISAAMAVNISRLASLRMWESFHRQDALRRELAEANAGIPRMQNQGAA